ncbi:hypothetical protein BS47DRAFT_1399940 [Hydnum rufescens UP504]|uniref:Uncharacterized protein n=1 Tax=Hydnum rufescens UP504 TaxID=1448309 RepID=A0A9P6AHQ8_9AGAM|nr:hypothetical protein BS47DRAFT_1399940 [Hydnum rufescens UP504]
MLYRRARTKEIKASGVRLPVASVLSKQAAEEWRRDAPLRLKFKKLADELRQEKRCGEENFSGHKIPVRRKSQIKINKKARETYFSASGTLPSVSPHSASNAPSLSSTSLPENGQFKDYSFLPHPPPFRTVSNVFSRTTDTSSPSGHISSPVFYPLLDLITYSSSPYQSLFAYGSTAPPLHAGSVPSPPHVACSTDLAHVGLWPVPAIEAPQLSAHVSHEVSAHAPVPGFHSSYTHTSPSISTSQFFEPPSPVSLPYCTPRPDLFLLHSRSCHPLSPPHPGATGNNPSPPPSPLAVSYPAMYNLQHLSAVPPLSSQDYFHRFPDHPDNVSRSLNVEGHQEEERIHSPVYPSEQEPGSYGDPSYFDDVLSRYNSQFPVGDSLAGRNIRQPALPSFLDTVQGHHVQDAQLRSDSSTNAPPILFSRQKIEPRWDRCIHQWIRHHPRASHTLRTTLALNFHSRQRPVPLLVPSIMIPFGPSEIRLSLEGHLFQSALCDPPSLTWDIILLPKDR